MSTDIALQASTQQPDALIACILDMGELLLSNGAEVRRVEDTITRLCAAYGFIRIDVFSITSSIVVTVHNQDERIFTQTRRISSRDTDLPRIALVNSLSRQLCKEPVRVEQFRKRIEEIRCSATCPFPVQCVSYAVISAVFSVFFGGTVMDALAAALSGIWMFFVLYFIRKLRINDLLQSLIVSAVTAFFVVLLVHLGIGDTPEKITIGNIMLLIPGIAFTTALRDVINGDTISGLVGISEAVIKAVAIAIGFAAILMHVGGAL